MLDENEQEILGLWQKEQNYLAPIKESSPDLFVRPNKVGNLDILSLVGITLPYHNLPQGYIKYTPLDFIVEEIDPTGNPVLANTISSSVTGTPSPFIKGELVKVGISTLEAVKEIANKLKIKETQFNTAGIKDAEALTAQKFSVSKASAEQLAAYTAPNHFLKNLAYSDRHLAIGELQGNRFTILVRAESINAELIEKAFEDITKNGFWNYYWLQRFGNRVMTHWWGLLLLQNKHEKVLRSYLCEPGPNEIPYFANLRREGEKLFGNWAEMHKLYSPHAFNLRYELMLLAYLKEYRSDYIGAFRQIQDQVKLWVYAYGSFLTNRLLSSYVSLGQEPPAQIPQALGRSAQFREPYLKFMAEDQVSPDFENNVKRLDFIRFSDRTIPSKVRLKIGDYKVLPEGLALTFDLPKGSYATTFLGHMFSLSEGYPIPAWLNPKEYDLKQLFGQGNLKDIKEKFQGAIVTKDQSKN